MNTILTLIFVVCASAFAQDLTRRVTPRPPADCSKIPSTVVNGFSPRTGIPEIQAQDFRMGRKNGNWGIYDASGDGVFFKAVPPSTTPQICLNISNQVHCGAKEIGKVVAHQKIDKEIDGDAAIVFTSSDGKKVTISPEFGSPGRIKIKADENNFIELKADLSKESEGQYRNGMSVKLFKEGSAQKGQLSFVSTMKLDGDKLVDPDSLPIDGGSLIPTSSCQKNLKFDNDRKFNFQQDAQIETDSYGFISAGLGNQPGRASGSGSTQDGGAAAR